MSASTEGASLPWQEGISTAELPPTALRQDLEFEVRDVIGAYPQGWRPRPESEVASSWLRQVTLLDVPGARLRLQARLEEPALAGVVGEQYAHRAEPQWPFTAPLLVIGGVRGASVTYADAAVASRDEILRRLELLGIGAHSAWTLDRAHLWSEPSVVAFRAQPLADWRERALGIARQAGLDTVVQIDPGVWTVLAAGDSESDDYAPIAQAPASVTRDVERRCPLQTAPQPGEYCRMRGGPWTSASIAAAAGWKDYRDRLVGALGCDTCEGTRFLLGGELRTGGGPIPIVPIPMPTRWLRPADRESRGRIVDERG